MTQEGEQIFVNFTGVETAIKRDRAIMIHIGPMTRGGTFSRLLSFCHIYVLLLRENRPFSYYENECGSNDISLQCVEFSNMHNCDGSFNATLSNLAYKIV